MEESKKITLNLGDTSLRPELGTYYIDMRPARIHYEGNANIWGGKYDERGVPMIASDRQLHYFPINLAQYGFILHAEWLDQKEDKKLRQMLDVLDVLEELKTEDERYCVWWHREPHHKYGLTPPWASAMAQGEAISYYLRIYQITNNKALLRSAEKAGAFLSVDVKEGGVRRSFGEGTDWLEEYPSEPPSCVLNGFIYALFGMYDLYRVTSNEDLKKDIDGLVVSLKKKLPEFSTWYWSLYDLRRKELVRYYYQKNVHVPQMEVLAKLTGDPVFTTYGRKWKRQIRGLNFLFVRIMYRVRPRLQRFRNKYGKEPR